MTTKMWLFFCYLLHNKPAETGTHQNIGQTEHIRIILKESFMSFEVRLSGNLRNIYFAL